MEGSNALLEQTQADWSRLEQIQADCSRPEQIQADWRDMMTQHSVHNMVRLGQTGADPGRLLQTGADPGRLQQIQADRSRPEGEMAHRCVHIIRGRGCHHSDPLYITPSHSIYMQTTPSHCRPLHLSLHHSIPYFFEYFIQGISAQRHTQRCIISI